MKNPLIPVFALLAFLLLSCSANTEKPAAIQGTIDLRQWDFTSKPLVELSGEWEFFRGRFIRTPVDYQEKPGIGYFLMPGIWKGFKKMEPALKGQGYGSYVLTIKLPENLPQMGISIGEVRSSYELIAGWKRIGGVGRIGSSAEKSVPWWSPALYPMPPLPGSSIVVINVANFHYARGGIQRAPVIGTMEALSAAREKSYFYEIFLFGGIFLMAVYQVILHSSRQTERAPLYFALFCFLISGYLLSTGEVLVLKLLPGLKWKALVLITYLTLYLAPFFFTRYLYELFPNESSRLFRWIINTALSILFAAVLILPTRWYSETLVVFHIIVVFISIDFFRTIISAYFAGRHGALPLLAGIFILFACMANDILYYQGLLGTGDAVPTGVFILILTHGFALSRKSTTNVLEKELPTKDGSLSSEKIQQLDWAVSYIREHYTESISREGLASRLNMHPDNFGRFFRQHTGKKIGGMINELRIQSAMLELAEGNKNVLEIAMQVGFENLRTFNRVFKKITGISPNEYRKKNKNG